MRKSPVLFTILLCVALGWTQGCGKSGPSVVKPVNVYLAGYGSASMDDVAEVVTTKFRDGKPESVWVYGQWKVLQQIEYKRLSGEITKTAIDGDTALVSVRASISTAVGQSDQDEMYRLVRKNGKWLIDAVAVGNEEVSAMEQEL